MSKRNTTLDKMCQLWALSFPVTIFPGNLIISPSSKAPYWFNLLMASYLLNLTGKSRHEKTYKSLTAPVIFWWLQLDWKKKKKVSCPRFPVFSAGRQSMMNQSAITTREDALEGGFGYRSLHAWTQSWSCVLAGGATGGGGKCEVQKEC